MMLHLQGPYLVPGSLNQCLLARSPWGRLLGCMSSEGVMSGSLKVELDRARIKVNVCRVGRMKAAQATQQK